MIPPAACEAEACGSLALRVDTHPDNRAMQALLVREGFVYRGTVRYESPRRAYEKTIG